jgi:hypothetical protein
MVDNFAIAVSHLLVALTAWRLVWRPDLDKEDPPAKDDTPSGFFRASTTNRPRGDGDA